ncbi:MAG: hypothetical protein ABI653_02015 [Bacteroidota bacterium]
MNKIIICLFIFFLNVNFANAQLLNYHLINDSIQFEFKNNSSDTIYLFSSYLKPPLYHNKYLNRVDTKENILKISLLPIISQVYTVKTDVIFSGDEQIIKPFQFIYEFIKIAPGKILSFTLPYSEFKNVLSNQNKVVADFDSGKNFKQKRVKYFNKKQIASVNKIQYEFAIYSTINYLTMKGAESAIPDQFLKQARSYKIKSVQLIL